MKLNEISLYDNNRMFWLLLMLTGFGLLVAALVFQEFLHLKPCFLCINQRIAVFFIGVGGLIGFIKPDNKILKTIGYFFWGFFSLFGIVVASYQTYIQLHPPTFQSCGAGMGYILKNNSLVKAIPLLLKPTGECHDIQWTFLHFSIPQWMIIVFFLLFIGFTTVLISKFKG